MDWECIAGIIAFIVLGSVIGLVGEQVSNVAVLIIGAVIIVVPSGLIAYFCR